MQRNIKTAIVKYLQNLPSGEILDIPSGACWLEKELNLSKWVYYPADLYTETANLNFKKVDLNNDLPYPDSHFDYIAYFEGLEHIENYHHVLREFSRILKKGGEVIISTPNPLNIKSRIRYLLIGTFYGFPQLLTPPLEGEHLHMTPINLSFLISFAEKYNMSLDKIHSVPIKLKMYRFLIHCIFLTIYIKLKFLLKDANTRNFINRLVTFNVLLNDNILLSFKKV